MFARIFQSCSAKHDVISSVHVVYKLHACRNIASVYITAVQSLFLRSFDHIQPTPEKVEPLFIVRRQAVSAISFITRRGEYDPTRCAPSLSDGYTNVDNVSV